tara:strand:- start:3 stop:1247 length:1245 start_codon:yes stop_codon:yes gene_type:complete
MIRETGSAPSVESMINQIVDEVEHTWAIWPKPVVNATGVVLHTNLGRAPLGKDLSSAAASSSFFYSDLELNMDTGKRGSRNSHISKLLSKTTGSQAGLAVNNNAAAVLLCLAAVSNLKSDVKEVIVSRGEAVEIGGGFRIPDVMQQSGAKLIEVGTTNRTYPSDYETAITPNTAAILKVHPSNFVVDGFTHVTTVAELVEVGKKHQIPVINDLGSGCLVDTRKYGLKQEAQPQTSVSNGVALTLFSGDKLLGGPQSGLIVGEKKWIEIVSKHPLARAVRIDKMTLASTAATLGAYLKGSYETDIPIWNMISMNESKIMARAERWQQQTGVGVIASSRSTIGGGSLPGQTLPTTVLSIRPEINPDQFMYFLRDAKLTVIGRIENEKILLDPRTVIPQQDDAVIEAVISAHERSAN